MPHPPHRFVLATAFFLVLSALPSVSTGEAPPKAQVTTLKPEELLDFHQQPQAVQEIITAALKLTERSLTYTYGSADPERGGMDCSGTIYHLLRSQKITTVPRQSDHICGWVMKNAALTRTDGIHTFDHSIFATLQPGHLLFWSGTYAAGERKIPVTHVMLYLGKRRSDGKPLIFGASNGRSYEGQRQCGVSVFDFKVPSAASKSTLYGFGPIPGIPHLDKAHRAPKDVPTKAPQEEIRRAEPSDTGKQ